LARAVSFRSEFPKRNTIAAAGLEKLAPGHRCELCAVLIVALQPDSAAGAPVEPPALRHETTVTSTIESAAAAPSDAKAALRN
jgi:hypothetical protein